MSNHKGLTPAEYRASLAIIEDIATQSGYGDHKPVFVLRDGRLRFENYGVVLTVEEFYTIITGLLRDMVSVIADLQDEELVELYEHWLLKVAINEIAAEAGLTNLPETTQEA